MNVRPTLAICYDFDKTLSPDDMQAQGYIQSVGYNVSDFWQECNKLAESNGMDQNLAYMYLMPSKARGKVVFTKQMLRDAGAKVELFPGVDTWFDRINRLGDLNGINVEHYIISSGLKEMIEGTSVAGKFKEIYASSYYFDKTGVAVWPAQVINYTNKTQFLFRIEKGVLGLNDQRVNDFFEPDEYRVPFRNMVYIGDSDTDIPCMKLVNLNGGHAIGVYNSQTQDKSKVFKMLSENRIKYYAPADYTAGSTLEQLVQRIIERTAVNEVLEKFHFACEAERAAETKGLSEQEKLKEKLINNLEESFSFAYTHSVIAQIDAIYTWSEKQKHKLMQIALTNNQVTSILCDDDVRKFYTAICKGSSFHEAYEILGIIEEYDLEHAEQE